MNIILYIRKLISNNQYPGKNIKHRTLGANEENIVPDIKTCYGILLPLAAT